MRKTYVLLAFSAAYMAVIVFGINYKEKQRNKRSELLKESQILCFEYGWLIARRNKGIRFNKEEHKKDSLHFINTMFK